jgi:hypothetical protein
MLYTRTMSYNATEHHTQVLADLLMSKEAEKPSTNIEEGTDGVNTNQQASSEGEEYDGLWGSGPENKVVRLSDAALQGIVQSRDRLLSSLFDSKEPASKAERALIGQQFSASDYESRAPLLEKSSQDATLQELTRGILD